MKNVVRTHKRNNEGR